MFVSLFVSLRLLFPLTRCHFSFYSGAGLIFLIARSTTTNVSTSHFPPHSSPFSSCSLPFNNAQSAERRRHTRTRTHTHPHTHTHTHTHTRTHSRNDVHPLRQ